MDPAFDSESENETNPIAPGDDCKAGAMIPPAHQLSPSLRWQGLPRDDDFRVADSGALGGVDLSSIPVPRTIELDKPGAVDMDATAEPSVAIRHPHRSNFSRTAFIFFATVVTSFFALWFVGPKLVEEYYYAAELGRARGEYQNAVAQLDKDTPLNEVSLAYQLVAQRIRPSVVSVSAAKTKDGARGIGSGVIFSEDGYIITNAHVVKEASGYRIELYNRRTYSATLIGIDASSDVAVLKINAPDLIPATWGDSDNLDVGSIVWAIGNPYGFQQTITSGVLSGKDRPGDFRHRKQSLLQTDAAVNPGNSGGPLVDELGHVIGINTSIYGETFQGISFAVPSKTARFVFDEIVKAGKVKRGYLGVQAVEVNHRFAEILKMPDLYGARLNYVQPLSPAYRAGVKSGDVVRSWNGTLITDHRQLFRMSESTPPNTNVELVLLRNGIERTANVTLGELPSSAESKGPSEFSRGM